MRLTTSLLAAAATAAGLSAQTNPEYDLYSGSTSFTSRHAAAGPDEAWITMHYSARHERGLGQIDDGNPGNATGIGNLESARYVLQDQGGTTQEPFSFGIFNDDAAMPGQPDANVDATTGRPNPPVLEGPFNTPSTTNTGAVAWIFTTTFTTPYQGFAMEGSNYLGILLPGNGAWTADGVSIHGSWYTAGGAGDNPSQGALTSGPMGGSVIYDTVHGINITAGNTVAPAPNDRQARIWGRYASSILKVGADISANPRSGVNPNYGIGGLYPDHALRQDGIAMRVQSTAFDNTAGAQCFGLLQFGTGFVNNGFEVIFGAGMQYLDVTGQIFAFPLTPGADANTWEQIIVAAGSTPAIPLGNITAQAVLADFAAPGIPTSFTNAVNAESL